MQSPEPLRRIATIIDALGSSRVGLVSGRLAEITDLPIPTVHRTLRNLIAIGYVEHDGPGTPFRLGKRLLGLVKPVLSDEDIAETARPILQRLADHLGCVTGLSRYSPVHNSDPILEVLPLDRGRTLVLAGRDFPLHATASGKIYLSQMGEADLAAMLDEPLAACRPATITDPADLRRHLSLVRRQGYATCRDECDPGVHSIAVPVHLARQGLLFTAGVVGLRQHLFERGQEKDVARLVKVAGQELVARLDGYEPQPVAPRPKPRRVRVAAE